MKILYFFIIFLIALLFIICFMNFKNNFIKKNEKYKPIPKINDNNIFLIKSCECTDLMTSHQGRIEHKLKCPIFRKLNPNLTVKQFMNHEGFPTNGEMEWPQKN